MQQNAVVVVVAVVVVFCSSSFTYAPPVSCERIRFPFRKFSAAPKRIYTLYTRTWFSSQRTLQQTANPDATVKSEIFVCHSVSQSRKFHRKPSRTFWVVPLRHTQNEKERKDRNIETERRNVTTLPWEITQVLFRTTMSENVTDSTRLIIIIIIRSLSATSPFPRASARLFCSAHAVELSPDPDWVAVDYSR